MSSKRRFYFIVSSFLILIIVISSSAALRSGNDDIYAQLFHADRLSGQPRNSQPNQPNNLSPANGATGISLTPTLQSSTFSDPDVGDTHAASQWQITTTAGNYNSPVIDNTDGSNLTSVNVPPGNLSYDTPYYWHVRHQDNHGAWSSYSSETSFATEAAPNTPPNQPNNLSPANGATGISLTPTLQSSTFSDPDVGDTHAASQWQITTTAGNYNSPVIDNTDGSNLTSVNVPPGNLSYDTPYYWHVRHQDNHGAWSSYSSETSFATTTLPATPLPSCPSPHLTAAITDISTSAPSVGEQFTVTAQVTNTGAGDATDVTADLGYSDASIVAGANPQLLNPPFGNLTSGQSATANWTLRCDGVGYGTITVDPEGINACSLQAIPEWHTDEASKAVRQACFIATAAYGTSTAAEIDTLRAFRDEVLLQNSLGSHFVALYYEVSPPVADFISEHEGLRTLVRELLVDPVAWLVEATGTLWRD